MDHQPDLFDDDGSQDFAPCDPSVPPPARPRLSRQCRAILDRLRRGPAMNTELAMIALKYSGRVSDIRKAGYRIKCTPINVKTGLHRYELLD